MTGILVVGAIMLYMVMAASTFVVSHMIMSHVLDIRGSMVVPMALLAGLLFPITAVLLVVSVPVMLVVWYVKNEL